MLEAILTAENNFNVVIYSDATLAAGHSQHNYNAEAWFNHLRCNHIIHVSSTLRTDI